jgi:hypothetical protein
VPLVWQGGIMSAYEITDEQIDSAWAEAFSFGTMSRGAINALAELNIFRCEDCIDGKFGTETCSTCNGHEWVRGKN